MDTFLIDVPMPSMGATVNELTVVTLKDPAGARVAKGQKIGELESDKSVFEFESPCDGTVRAIHIEARARPALRRGLSSRWRPPTRASST
jgi:pyruvate/2-oxoglutarate dehydrogenase complex dihydrolipoamide acyltransferase (E2) component